jgi:hypothetical protein
MAQIFSPKSTGLKLGRNALYVMDDFRSVATRAPVRLESGVPCRAIRRLCACIVVVVAVILAVAPGSAVAATSTTINFDDLAPGTALSNQYDAQGVDFLTGIVGMVNPNVYCFPVIKAVAPGRLSPGLTRYTFRGSVELLSPAHGGTYVSQQVTRVASFRG